MSFNNRKKNQTSDKTTPETSIEFQPSLPIKIIGFCILGGLGYLMLLNVQPWLDVAELAAKEVKVLPFQDTLVSIPYLGGLILWSIVNGAKILAIFLWGIVNGLESLPFFVETAFGDKVPKWIKKDLNTYRLIGYVTETIVCWVRYPTYTGGWSAVVSDFPNFDMALIDWGNVVVFLLSILGFELCLQAAKRIWAMMHALKSAKA
jgi:hypothetical protein